jgi:hypothetical protein
VRPEEMRYENGHFPQCNEIVAYFTSVIRGMPEAATSILKLRRVLL